MVMAQLADVVNKLQPADSWRAPVTAADVASVSIEEMTARMKVPTSRKQLHSFPKCGNRARMEGCYFEVMQDSFQEVNGPWFPGLPGQEVDVP